MSAGSSEILELVLRVQDCEFKNNLMQYDQHIANTLACMFYMYPYTPDLNDQLVINPVFYQVSWSRGTSRTLNLLSRIMV